MIEDLKIIDEGGSESSMICGRRVRSENRRGVRSDGRGAEGMDELRAMSEEVKTYLPQPGPLFVPDISGFTHFVATTEVEHSRHIIQELLEKLIDANDIDLTVSEIEGDAILFYRFGDAPAPDQLFRQIEKMFVAFHGHLRRYETQRICQCGACVGANKLTLKVVADYGDLSESRV